MIKKELLKKISEQIKFEYESAFIYKQMSIELEDKGWSGFAHWMHEQYREEIDHAEEMIKYVLERGEMPELKDIKMTKLELKSPIDYFQKSYDHECLVSEKIDEIVAVAIEQKDYATENFFRTFVDEQVEEEDTVSGILDQLKLANSEVGFLILDQKLGTR